MAAARKSATSSEVPPITVVFGDEEFQKSQAIEAALNAALPPAADRAMSLCIYDGTANEEQGGPTVGRVLEDLQTLPFLAPRRVVLIRDADKFISAAREKLERYAEKPSPTGVLMIECRAFPKTTRLYKAIESARGVLHECRRLNARGLGEFVLSRAQGYQKRMPREVAGLLVDLIGADQGLLANEVEKLATYVGRRPEITVQDVRDLIGQSREEKIFAVMDAAGAGDLPAALRLWSAVLATDPAAAYRAAGGLAFVLRKWLAAHELLVDGQTIPAIAPKVMMWGRERELDALLRRLPAAHVRRLLAQLATVDSQAKSGTRSIENGVEALLISAAGGD